MSAHGDRAPNTNPTPDDAACGCVDLTDHAEPHTDPTLHIAHGERDDLNGDPLPHDVPGTGGWNGLYTGMPDKFCLCGHPNYMTCEAWANGGGVMGLTMHNVGGYYLTTSEGASS